VNKLTTAFLSFALSLTAFAANPGGINREAEKQAAQAQKSAAQAAPHSPMATATCSFTFTSGSIDTFQKFCVTANGNITQFEAPQGHEHIAVGQIGEGYGICDLKSNTAYFDYAEYGDSGNWGPPSVVNQTPTSVKIARTTTDGIWTLTQTITQVAGNTPSVKVGMALKNNSSIQRAATIFRYADVDADGLVHNNVDMTFASATIWNSIGTGDGFGLQIQNATKGAIFQPITESTPDPPDVCTLRSNVDLATNTDGSMGIFYEVAVPKGSSKTVIASYTGF
jgi:hypothetical protein